MPTAKGKIFHYPQILVEAVWKDLVKDGRIVEVKEGGLRCGFAEEYFAQEIIDLHIEQTQKSMDRLFGHHE